MLRQECLTLAATCAMPPALSVLLSPSTVTSSSDPRVSERCSRVVKPIDALPTGFDGSVVGCSPIGCDLGPYYRLGWGP